MTKSFSISFDKLRSSNPENLKRLARFIGLDDSPLHDELASMIACAINMPMTMSESRRNEYTSVWENFASTE